MILPFCPTKEPFLEGGNMPSNGEDPPQDQETRAKTPQNTDPTPESGGESPPHRDILIIKRDHKKIPARRKPEKSRIVRVYPNEGASHETCPHCFSEFSSIREVEKHMLNCKSRNTIPGLEISDLKNDLSKHTHDRSIKTNDDSDSTDGVDLRGSDADNSSSSENHHNLFKLLRGSLPPMNPTQQLALEVILKAQMSANDNNGENSNFSNALPPEHHQQLLQFQLLQILHAQFSVNGERKVDLSNSNHSIGREDLPSNNSPLHTFKENVLSNNQISLKDNQDELQQNNINELKNNNDIQHSDGMKPSTSPSLVTKSISSLVIHHPDSPPPVAPNTLEMLQKTADDVLNNASKGLLASRLIDSCREADNRDPNKRHRCRYCGKVFSSDSGLQIHIRSHTGERPFKCNVCGNRFTTKGNLKVHFQRHSEQFPNLKMNGNPVPEHLDKFYPPILPPNSENLEENGPMPASSRASLSVSPLGPVSPPYNSDNILTPRLNFSFKSPFNEDLIKSPPNDSFAKDVAKNLLDLRILPPYMRPNLNNLTPNPLLENELKRDLIKYHESLRDDDDSQEPLNFTENARPKEDETDTEKEFTTNSLKIENNTLNTSEHENNLSESENADLDKECDNEPLNLRNDSNDEYSQLKNDDIESQNKDDIESDSNNADADVNKNQSESKVNALRESPIEFSHFPYLGMPLPPNLSILQRLQIPIPGTPLSQPSGLPIQPGFDARAPQIYSSLLPRPGSTDNSWEALIEIEKSNENEKIEQLIDRSKEKATEPNQCAICQRVLSCKSALQMHYRIHTGERPFKCKLCSRSFTTKGNLKTHMSVHRAKPPVRMLQQCPICHKKFSNALILQQHIRLHTGEPTDFSPDQIKAAEIRDFGLDMGLPIRFPALGPMGISPMPPRPPFPPLHLPHPFLRPPNTLRKDDSPDNKVPLPYSTSPRSSSTGSSEQHSAEDLSLRGREEENNGDNPASRSLMVSPTLSDYSDNEDGHQDRSRDINDPLEPLRHNPTYPLREPTYHENSPETTSGVMGLGLPPGIGFPPLSKDGTIKPPAFPFFPPLGFMSPLKSNVQNLYHINGMAIPAASEGNTTCKICFKIFACHSALEIHLRSHTKERPYQCQFCDRKFSTKGNMKQHLATHKESDINGSGGTDDIRERSPVSEGNNSSGAYDEECQEPPREVTPPSHGVLGVPDIPGTLGVPSEPRGETEHRRGEIEEEKSDVRIKRSREGEILTLPDAKRYSGAADAVGARLADESSSSRASPEDGRPNAFGFYSSLIPPSLPLPPTSATHFAGGLRPPHFAFTHPGQFPLTLPLSLAAPLPIPKNDSLHG